MLQVSEVDQDASATHGRRLKVLPGIVVAVAALFGGAVFAFGDLFATKSYCELFPQDKNCKAAAQAATQAALNAAQQMQALLG
jgi:hypothetical protein